MEVEIGYLLDKEYGYYYNLLKKKYNLSVFCIESWDEFYAKDELSELSENEIKNSCLRIRKCRNVYLEDNTFGNVRIEFQNMKIISELNKKVEVELLDEEIEKIKVLGYKHIIELDTHKMDYQISLLDYSTTLYFQLIDNIGLVLYYYNERYFGLELLEQRKKLIDELNSFGFNFKYEDLGIDKLRTLYYKKEMFSLNQNA